MTCRLAMMATVAPYFVSSSRFWASRSSPGWGWARSKAPMWARDRMSDA